MHFNPKINFGAFALSILFGILASTDPFALAGLAFEFPKALGFDFRGELDSNPKSKALPDSIKTEVQSEALPDSTQVERPNELPALIQSGDGAFVLLILSGVLVSAYPFALAGLALRRKSPRSFELSFELEKVLRFDFRSELDTKPEPEALPASNQVEKPELSPTLTKAEEKAEKL